MSINEKLIAEARTHRAAPGYEADVDMIRRLADALEAAEKAHIPTDDEREAVVLRAIRAADDADEYGDPVIEAWSDGERFTSADLRALAAGFRRSEVHGEPSDAETVQHLRGQIEEARNAWWSATEQGDTGLVYTDKIEDAMDEIWSAIGDASWTPEPQGEPSDAQVLAALNATVRPDQEAPDLSFWGVEKADRMRSALRAARGVQ